MKQIYIYRYRNILIVLRSRNLQCFSQSLQDNVESFTAISFTIARTSPTASPFTSKKSRSTKKSTKAWLAFSSTGLTLTGQLPRQKCRCQWDGWNWKGYQNRTSLEGWEVQGAGSNCALPCPYYETNSIFGCSQGNVQWDSLHRPAVECCTEIMHSKQQKSFSNRINTY